MSAPYAVLQRALGSTGPRRQVLRLVAACGLLLLMLGVGVVASAQAPTRMFVTGLWPIGLGTAAVLTAPVRARVPVSLGVGVVAVVSTVLSDVPDSLAAGYAATAALEVYAAAYLLRGGDGRRPELRTDEDLRRYFLAATVAAGHRGDRRGGDRHGSPTSTTTPRAPPWASAWPTWPPSWSSSRCSCGCPCRARSPDPVNGCCSGWWSWSARR